jgi:hypothetical protein
MTRDAVGRHVDILAIAAVLSGYALIVAGQSGIQRFHSFVQQKRTVIERMEHHRRIAPARIVIDARNWLRRA